MKVSFKAWMNIYSKFSRFFLAIQVNLCEIGQVLLSNFFLFESSGDSQTVIFLCELLFHKKRLKLSTAVISASNLQYKCLCVLFIANYLQIECNICIAILRILWAFLILAVIGSWGWINKCWENMNHNNCAEKVINYNISLQSIFRYEKWPRMTNMCIEHTSKT